MRCWIKTISCFLLIYLMFSDSASANGRHASLAMDVETGHIIQSENLDETRYPASLTKMMTLYLMFDALEQGQLKLQQKLPVSANAYNVEPTKLGLKAGDQVTVEHVIAGMVVKSANDAAVVAAEALGGSVEQFAVKMTQKAKSLGMTKTTFRNPHGLPDPKQVSTARDLAVLARALMLHHTKYFHYFGLKEFQFRGQKLKNHNKLLQTTPGVNGMKTGYIRASGYNLVTTAHRQQRNVITVYMGGATSAARNQKVQQMIETTFSALPPIQTAEYIRPPRPPQVLHRLSENDRSAVVQP